MGARSTVPSTKYLIERRDPKTGHVERITFTGRLRDKPKGWKVVKKVEG